MGSIVEQPTRSARIDPAARVDSPRTGWKWTRDSSDADEDLTVLGSWHKDAWAEWQQREHVSPVTKLVTQNTRVFIK